jgi:hypothetical protein
LAYGLGDFESAGHTIEDALDGARTPNSAARMIHHPSIWLAMLALVRLKLGDVDGACVPARESVARIRSAQFDVPGLILSSVASTALLKDQPVAAARLSSFGASHFAVAGTSFRLPMFLAAYDELGAALEAKLAPEELARHYAGGARLTLDGAIGEALSAV